VRGVLRNLALCERLSFRLAWLISSAQLRLLAGSTFHYLPPSGPEAALGYSVIIRPPQHIVSSVTAVFERLCAVGSHHYYYPADSMHVTVGDASRFLSDDSNATARLAELRAVIGSYPSFDLTLRGLNVSPSTVFAQVIPHDRTLHSLRVGLRLSGPPADEVKPFGTYIRDLLPHMNIIRFSGNVTADFLEEVSRSRQVWWGRWTVSEVEIMRTDTLLSREGRQVLERIPLAAVHPSA
jgi:2'-5' RNA ligase